MLYCLLAFSDMQKSGISFDSYFFVGDFLFALKAFRIFSLSFLSPVNYFTFSAPEVKAKPGHSSLVSEGVKEACRAQKSDTKVRSGE